MKLPAPASKTSRCPRGFGTGAFYRVWGDRIPSLSRQARLPGDHLYRRAGNDAAEQGRIASLKGIAQFCCDRLLATERHDHLVTLAGVAHIDLPRDGDIRLRKIAQIAARRANSLRKIVEDAAHGQRIERIEAKRPADDDVIGQ